MRRLAICLALEAWCATAAAEDPDATFRAQIEALARARHRVVLSWGTVRLDEKEQPHRFAALGVELGADNGPARAADTTGAYIVEAEPGKLWLIAYPWDATSFHVSDGEGPDGRGAGHPPWLDLPEVAIWHGLNHNHGKAYVWIALRGGQLVALADEDTNVRREPESIRHDFATDGVCKKPCPTLVGTYKVNGYQVLRVVGWARSVQAVPAF